ncbi:diguanylate cyclase [Campylobacterota bacterium]
MHKVLIVDDSQTILNVLKSELENHPDIEPIFATSNKEAMRAIREHQGDIQAAILDYNLPDAPNGEVVSLANSHNIPSIVLTGSLDKSIRNIILKKNVVDFILKNDPSSIGSAVNSVHKVLKNYDMTVLVVDDSKLSRELIKMSLETIHLNILEAENGREALDMINDEKNNINLVITDFQMPEMDGLDLTFTLREQYTKAELSIIAVSAAEDEETVSKFLKFGANDFINKPPTPSEVITTVNSNLEILDLFEQVRNLANRDFLTGAYNRRYFFDAGSAIFSKAKRKELPLAVAMLDIDKFKNINDTYGHDVGDIAIKEIKRILDETLRASDLVARFGGEEFCIVLEDITLEDTKSLFERIRKRFEDNIIQINDTKISYTVSLGVAYGMEKSLDEMVKLSDEALYFSKENGRNQVKIDVYNI